jgi:hypothetical protein
MRRAATSPPTLSRSLGVRNPRGEAIAPESGESTLRRAWKPQGIGTLSRFGVAAGNFKPARPLPANSRLSAA